MQLLTDTKLSFCAITAGSPAKRLLKDTVDPGKVPKLRTQRSALSDLLEGGGTVLTRTVEALDRVNRVLSDQNIKKFGDAIEDAQAVTAELRERKALIGDAQKALQSIDTAAAQITELTKSSQDLVDGEGKRTLANLADAAGHLVHRAAEHIGKAGAENRQR